jgi:signal transduction histidine kinase
MRTTPAANLPLPQAYWRTLRFRLAAWNAGAVVVTALLTLVGLRQGVQWALLHELDQVLVDDAHEIALALESATEPGLPRLKEELERKAAGHRQRGWYVRLCDKEENVLFVTPEAPPHLAPASAFTASVPLTFEGTRVVRLPVSANVGDVHVIRVGATLRHVYDDIARIDRLVAVAAGAVVIAAPLCGYWLAARAARTVAEITEAASRMRPAHLDERLPIQGTGDELDCLAGTINGLLDRIAEHLKRKRDFLANAAHELRTPLAAIRSSVEVALASDRSPEAYRELLVDIIEEGAMLETLVNQLLLISETEGDRERQGWERTPLDEIVAKAVDMFRGVAESRDVTLDVERLDRVAVQGNRVHLRQLVSNLLDNAIKYTPSGGTVRVRLATVPERGVVQFRVADNGAGIDAADMPMIFDRFFRSDRARSRDETAGAGLGLSICKSVAESHGGTLRCESQLGAGTTMIAELPLPSAADGDPPSESVGR